MDSNLVGRARACERANASVESILLVNNDYFMSMYDIVNDWTTPTRLRQRFSFNPQLIFARRLAFITLMDLCVTCWIFCILLASAKVATNVLVSRQFFFFFLHAMKIFGLVFLCLQLISKVSCYSHFFKWNFPILYV